MKYKYISLVLEHIYLPAFFDNCCLGEQPTCGGGGGVEGGGGGVEGGGGALCTLPRNQVECRQEQRLARDIK